MIQLQPSYYEVLIQEAVEQADMNRSPEATLELEKKLTKIHKFIFLSFAIADICAAIVLQDKMCKPHDFHVQIYQEPTCLKTSQLSFFLIGILGLIYAGIKKKTYRNDPLKLSNELVLFMPIQIVPFGLCLAKL